MILAAGFLYHGDSLTYIKARVLLDISGDISSKSD
jgi:hypothetical protein